MVETQFASKIKKIRINNGLEFCLTQFYASKGIVHQTSCVETPQQNAIVERKHQSILNIARSLLFQGNLPKSFWSFAILHAVFLLNRLPTTALNNSTPYEKLFSKLLDISFLKVFGFLAFASTLIRNHTKLDPQARKCIFLGYHPGTKGTKGFLLYDLKNREVFISKHVIFHENVFPFHTYSHPNDTSLGAIPLPLHHPVPDDKLPTVHQPL